MKTERKGLALSAVMASVAALCLASSFNGSALAHVREGDNDLKKHEGFILKMKDKEGKQCCNLLDGRGNLEEQSYKGKDGKVHYRVKVTETSHGKPLAGGGQWVDVPDDRVLSYEHAIKVCRELPASDPDKATCKPPPFGVAWLMVEDELEKLDPLSTFGKVTKPEPGSGQKPILYNFFCYMPKPKVAM